MWIEALNVAGVPANSEWRKAANVYYLEDLQKALKVALGLGTDATLAPPAPEQLSTTQTFLPPLEAIKGPGKANDPGHGVEVAKGKEVSQGKAGPEDKGKGKEAKDAAPKAKETAPKATDPLSSTQPAKKTSL